MIITLPWPPKELSSNARHAHWSAHARAKKRYRAACALQSLAQGATHLQAEKIALSLVFVPPNRQRRDADNCLAAMKSGLDGLADALGVDDSRFRITFGLAEGEVGGFVRVEVAPCPA